MLKAYKLILPFVAIGVLASCVATDLVKPSIKLVLASGETLEPSGDFYRAILRNTEIEPCLTLDRVNLRREKARIVKLTRVCGFQLNEPKEFTVATDSVQEIDYSDLKWKKTELHFRLGITKAEPGALYRRYECVVETKTSEFVAVCN